MIGSVGMEWIFISFFSQKIQKFIHPPTMLIEGHLELENMSNDTKLGMKMGRVWNGSSHHNSVWFNKKI